MKRETLMTVLLGVLVLVSAFQAFQLMSLGEQITQGELAVKKLGTSSGSSTGGSSTLQNNISSLPAQVGGC